MIEIFAKRIPKDFFSKSGKVFYSGRKAFDDKVPIYLLGINPGGDPTIRSEETVESHTQYVLNMANSDWSAYRDESWGGPPGTSGMQPRVLHLLKNLKIPAGNVPASNLVFVRSCREREINGKLTELCEIFWPFHKYVIEQLNPTVVICFGKTAGNFVCKKLNAKEQIDQFTEMNNRRWTSKAYVNAERKIIVVTHPSVADWTARDTDPTELVKRALMY
jgi:uracil-DNA glycosylase family 4